MAWKRVRRFYMLWLLYLVVSLDAHASWLSSDIQNEDGQPLACWIHVFGADGKPQRAAWSHFLCRNGPRLVAWPSWWWLKMAGWQGLSGATAIAISSKVDGNHQWKRLVLVRGIAENPKTFHYTSTAPFYVKIGQEKRQISKALSRLFLDWVNERIGRVNGNITDQS